MHLISNKCTQLISNNAPGHKAIISLSLKPINVLTQ